MIDLAIEHAHLVAIPRFPTGWQFKIENPIDDFPTLVFGGATGSLAELDANDLKCFLKVEYNVPSTARIAVTGSVYISTGEHERRVFLRPSDIVLERIKAPDEP